MILYHLPALIADCIINTHGTKKMEVKWFARQQLQLITINMLWSWRYEQESMEC